MQTKFIEIRPLFSRLFYEKSSNFRKMFRRVLKFERAKFEVATFRGNQTKIRDTKLQAANFYTCMMCT